MAVNYAPDRIAAFVALAPDGAAEFARRVAAVVVRLRTSAPALYGKWKFPDTPVWKRMVPPGWHLGMTAADWWSWATWCEEYAGVMDRANRLKPLEV